jgi:hypothetical protein
MAESSAVAAVFSNEKSIGGSGGVQLKTVVRVPGIEPHCQAMGLPDHPNKTADSCFFSEISQTSQYR